MKANPLIEITCAGSHEEMGVEQGKWFKPRKKKFLKALTDNPFVPLWLRLGGANLLRMILFLQGLATRWGHLSNIRRFSPSQMERMRGISRGAGVSFNLLLGLASIETRSAHFQYVMGCSSFGVGRTRSANQSPFLAYNHDFPFFFRDLLFVRRSHPKKGYRSLQLTYPSMAGAICGVNSEGLAITLNHAFTTEPFNHAVPPTFFVQEALDRCRDVREVVSFFKQVQFSCGSIVTVVDEKGNMAALELARGRSGVRRPRGDLSLSLNAYQLIRLREIEIPQEAFYDPARFPKFFHGIEIHRHNWERRARFHKLLDRKKKFSPSEIKKYLADHNGGKTGGLGTICRHHPTTDTIATAVLYPRQRILEAARGHACGANYRQYILK